ncbi:MAG: 2-hydroxyglutaryl-CoA dehydratase [Deltaproteobacteria bacterium RIFOXYA12_FULL_61_11]|nr:MAG: 2-hydroxyglutaryl-CoA dehydratase [Deltaproteobacteria bacterium RIFOXYA12_FULL_61_11]
MIYLGLDIGSLTCDAVAIDSEGRFLAGAVVPTGARNLEAIARARTEVLAALDPPSTAQVVVVSTGYGRDRVADRLAAVTEITCHAEGIADLLPRTTLLIDIGGQDSKAIRLDAGKVLDFAMNDKCAAGTGRFLEAMARALEIEVTELQDLDAATTSTSALSSMCTVFAESEVVSLLAGGTAVPSIVRGLHRAIAVRTAGLVRRVAPSLTGLSISMSGGVAHNAGVVRALSEELGLPISVPPRPDLVGALGAALIARRRHLGSTSSRPLRT